LISCGLSITVRLAVLAYSCTAFVSHDAYSDGCGCTKRPLRSLDVCCLFIAPWSVHGTVHQLELGGESATEPSIHL